MAFASKFMGLKPTAKEPVPTPLPATPAEDPAQIAARNAAAEEERKNAGKGYASTILTGTPLGDTSEAQIAKKTLLGF